MKPGKVPGPVKVKPNKKSDLTDYRRAKRVQDYLNWALGKQPSDEELISQLAKNGIAVVDLVDILK